MKKQRIKEFLMAIAIVATAYFLMCLSAIIMQ